MTRTGARGALATSLAVSVGIQACNLVTGVVIARELGVEGRGELTAILLGPSILAVVGALGVSDALTYFTARREDRLGALVGTATSLTLAQSLVLVAIGFAVEPLILHRYGTDALHTAWLMLAFIPLSLGTLHLAGIVNGQQRLRSYQLLRGLVIAATLVAIAAFASGGDLTVRQAVYAYLLANAATLLVAIALLAGRRGARPQRDRAVTRKVLRYGIRSHASNVSVLLNTRLDQLIVALALAPRSVGLYTVAVTMSAVVAQVGYSVAPVALPVVAGLEPGPQRNERARALVALTLAGSAAVAVPLIVFAGPLIELVYGEDFGDGATAARILLAAGAVFGTNRALEAVLKAVGEPLTAGVAELAGLATTCIALAVLLPLFGLTGAACASVAAALVSAALLARAARAALRVR